MQSVKSLIEPSKKRILGDMDREQLELGRSIASFQPVSTLHSPDTTNKR